MWDGVWDGLFWDGSLLMIGYARIGGLVGLSEGETFRSTAVRSSSVGGGFAGVSGSFGTKSSGGGDGSAFFAIEAGRTLGAGDGSSFFMTDTSSICGVSVASLDPAL